MRGTSDRATRNRTGRGHRGVVVAAAAVLLATASMQVGAATATAATPAATPAGTGDAISRQFVRTVGATVVDNQDALSTFRSWMITQPGFADSGYVGTVDDLAHRATAVLWSGPRTALLSAILAEGQRRGIAVTVQPRSHSLRQLGAAVDAVWKQAADGAWAGFTVSAIGAVGATENGLTVYGTGTPRVTPTAVDGVPVHVVSGAGAVDFTGRDNDTAPFGAGDFMISNAGSTCSTGFGIKVDGTSRVTTARHCDDGSYHDRDAATVIGSGMGDSGKGGGRVLSGHSSARARTGRFDSDDQAKTVIGFEDLGINDLVCTSGGNSGEHCDVKVRDLMVSFDDQTGKGTFTTIEGDQQAGDDIAAIEGDSGGPVLSLANGSAGQVRAAGMIQAGLRPLLSGAACGPVHDTADQCSKKVLFSSMRTIVGSIDGATLNTG